MTTHRANVCAVAGLAAVVLAFLFVPVMPAVLGTDVEWLYVVGQVVIPLGAVLAALLGWVATPLTQYTTTATLAKITGFILCGCILMFFIEGSGTA